MKSSWRSFSLIMLIAATLLNTAHSYNNTITVDAHAEKCFFENVEAGTKMGLTFDIIEGGFLDIDVTITGPDGTNIYKGERETSGMYTFSAPTSGKYTYCFNNKIFTMTYKVVMFSLEIGAAPQSQQGAKEEGVNHTNCTT